LHVSPRSAVERTRVDALCARARERFRSRSYALEQLARAGSEPRVRDQAIDDVGGEAAGGVKHDVPVVAVRDADSQAIEDHREAALAGGAVEPANHLPQHLGVDPEHDRARDRAARGPRRGRVRDRGVPVAVDMGIDDARARGVERERAGHSPSDERGQRGCADHARRVDRADRAHRPVELQTRQLLHQRRQIDRGVAALEECRNVRSAGEPASRRQVVAVDVLEALEQLIGSRLQEPRFVCEPALPHGAHVERGQGSERGDEDRRDDDRELHAQRPVAKPAQARHTVK
jgi:hypothetical protein